MRGSNQSKHAWRATIQFTAGQLGSSASKVTKTLLPDWWDDEIAESEEGFQEGVHMLANALSVSPSHIHNRSPLISDDATTRCKGTSDREKHRAAITFGELLARKLVEVFPKGAAPQRRSASQLRSELLKEFKRITLDILLAWCWENNIAVAHAGGHSPKPHAIATNIDGRCGIVLMRNHKNDGWQLYDLSHEIGHIMLGHLAENVTIVEFDDDGELEDQANAYALELLYGHPELFRVSGTGNADELLKVAGEAGVKYRVDPRWLIIAIGSAWGKLGLDRWAVVMSALKKGWPDDNAHDLINALMLSRLKDAEFSRNSISIIQSMTRGSD